MSVGARDRRIDLIRGVSILVVLLHHFNNAYRLDDTLPSRVLGWEAVRAVVSNGNYGVTMFFVVSGFLITSNAARRWGRLGDVRCTVFYGLRVARILPCLLLLLTMVDLLALGGVAAFRDHAIGGHPPSLWLANLAALTLWMNVLVGRDGWFNDPLGVLWSLSVEEAFYLSFPLLCLGLRREVRLVAVWVAVIVAGPLWRLAHQGDEGGLLYAYLACFDGIAIGCCAALLAGRVAPHGRGLRVAQALAAAGMVLLYLWRPIGQTAVLGVTAMALGTGLLLLGSHRPPAGADTRPCRILAPLTWLGRLSYELYLFHLVVLGFLRTAFPPRGVAGDARLVLLAAFLGLSAALAALVARAYAEPLNRGLRRLLPGGPVMVGAVFGVPMEAGAMVERADG